jgi:hypothetical protein
MKTKLMLGLAAVSLLASCGLIKTPQIVLQDTTKTVTPGSQVGGGALGIDGGKGAPHDVTNTELTNNLARLDEWGASQDIPSATLSGTDCSNIPSFTVTGISFMVTVTDAANSIGVTQAASSPDLIFTRGTGCNYTSETVTKSKAVIALAIKGAALSTFSSIIAQGGVNTATVKASYTTSDANLTGRSMVVNFGGSTSYIVANIF